MNPRHNQYPDLDHIPQLSSELDKLRASVYNETQNNRTMQDRDYGSTNRKGGSLESHLRPSFDRGESTRTVKTQSSSGCDGTVATAETSGSVGSGIRNLFSKKENARHSAIEKGLMRQLEIEREEKERLKSEYELKLRQRDDSIETLERMVILKNETVNALRDELENIQTKYQKQKNLLGKPREGRASDMVSQQKRRSSNESSKRREEERRPSNESSKRREEEQRSSSSRADKPRRTKEEEERCSRRQERRSSIGGAAPRREEERRPSTSSRADKPRRQERRSSIGNEVPRQRNPAAVEDIQRNQQKRVESVEPRTRKMSRRNSAYY